MKKIIKRIKELSKDHTRLTVLFLIVALFVVIFIVYTIAGKYFNYSTTSTNNYYIYLGSEKTLFEAEVTQNRKGLINAFVAKKDINFESIPIYSDDEVIFPSDMAIIIYNNGNYTISRVHTYSKVKGEEFITKEYNDKIEHYFLYDANNLYFMKDEGTLTIDNKDIKLSAHSYVVCTDDMVSYYDYASDKYESTQYKEKVVFEAQHYYINLREDTVGRTGDLLPSSLKYLKFLKK